MRTRGAFRPVAGVATGTCSPGPWFDTGLGAAGLLFNGALLGVATFFAAAIDVFFAAAALSATGSAAAFSATGSAAALSAMGFAAAAAFLADEGGTTSFGAVCFLGACFLTAALVAVTSAAGAFARGLLFAGFLPVDAAAAAVSAEVPVSAGATAFSGTAFFAGLCTADVLFAGSAVREPEPSARLRGGRVSPGWAELYTHVRGGWARRTSAATVSSRGWPDTSAIPGNASSAPRRCGSSAVSTKIPRSRRLSTSRALRGGGSPRFARGT